MCMFAPHPNIDHLFTSRPLSPLTGAGPRLCGRVSVVPGFCVGFQILAPGFRVVSGLELASTLAPRPTSGIAYTPKWLVSRTCFDPGRVGGKWKQSNSVAFLVTFETSTKTNP